MRVLSFLDAHRGLVAALMIALAVLAAPAPGYADTADVHSDIAAASDDHNAVGGHAAQDGAGNRSCHPDPSCSPAAILMTRPISGAQGFRTVRQSLAKTTIRGRNAPVHLPPPRTRAVPRPHSLNDTRT